MWIEVERGREAVLVTIADNGPGMPPEVRSSLRPFFTTKSGGLGLGLPLAYKIVRQHGGDLLLAERPPRGLSVRVRLPLARSTSDVSVTDGNPPRLEAVCAAAHNSAEVELNKALWANPAHGTSIANRSPHEAVHAQGDTGSADSRILSHRAPGGARHHRRDGRGRAPAIGRYIRNFRIKGATQQVAMEINVARSRRSRRTSTWVSSSPSSTTPTTAGFSRTTSNRRPLPTGPGSAGKTGPC